MLPRAHRLKGDARFKALAYKGRSFFSPIVTMRAARHPGEPLQFGFVVSTKVSKRAVVRNRIRRQLREIVRLELPKLSPGFHVLLIVKKQALECTYAQLHDAIMKLFTQAGFYHD